jgi:replication factor C small subunit
MEEFSANCGFILTCNFLNRIIAPLHSRCSVIQFKISNTDKPKLAARFLKRMTGILEKENVEFELAVVAQLIMKHFPDWRRVLNELQRYSATGKIDTGILANISQDNYKALVERMKAKDFSGIRKWVAENLDNEPSALFQKIFETTNEYVEPNSIPKLVLYMADYQYKSAFVVNQEINFVAFLTEVMMDCQFK